MTLPGHTSPEQNAKDHAAEAATEPCLGKAAEG